MLPLLPFSFSSRSQIPYSKYRNLVNASIASLRSLRRSESTKNILSFLRSVFSSPSQTPYNKYRNLVSAYIALRRSSCRSRNTKTFSLFYLLRSADLRKPHTTNTETLLGPTLLPVVRRAGPQVKKLLPLLRCSSAASCNPHTAIRETSSIPPLL